jgi:hypothetical protein
VATGKLAYTNATKATAPIRPIRAISDHNPLVIDVAVIRHRLSRVQGTENDKYKSREETWIVSEMIIVNVLRRLQHTVGEGGNKHLRWLSAGLYHKTSGTHEVWVWWRRRELNPGPKIVNAPHLHV